MTAPNADHGVMACKYSGHRHCQFRQPEIRRSEAIVTKSLRVSGPRGLNPSILPTQIPAKRLYPGDRPGQGLRLGCSNFKPQDIIVAAGKGHETYQITNEGTIHFDDKEHLIDACTRLLTPKPWTLTDLCTALGCEAATAAGQKLPRMRISCFQRHWHRFKNHRSGHDLSGIAGDRLTATPSSLIWQKKALQDLL